jgi:hypothetical protein
MVEQQSRSSHVVQVSLPQAQIHQLGTPARPRPLLPAAGLGHSQRCELPVGYWHDGSNIGKQPITRHAFPEGLRVCNVLHSQWRTHECIVP